MRRLRLHCGKYRMGTLGTVERLFQTIPRLHVHVVWLVHPLLVPERYWARPRDGRLHEVDRRKRAALGVGLVDVVNRQIVQDSLTTWRRLDLGYKPVTASQWAWYNYQTSRWLTKSWADGWSSGYYAGTYSQVWSAHQASLWQGVAASRTYYAREPEAERVVIFKVLANLSFYYGVGWNIDGLLGVMRWVSAYPSSYPATKRAACNMNYVGTIYYLSPAYWGTTHPKDLAKQYCG